ncbi:hypothetical protein H6P81_019411 [Aristolochia fimbriata]|uniref:Uncharacterized protein n=1 Tax=Aristolochia fimbriata TaxID=158543 RepID=A0AAV7DUI8_ARIFI|nr:hypothetical protein H6P81_019411 [Aristolochia fimbriata]
MDKEILWEGYNSKALSYFRRGREVEIQIEHHPPRGRVVVVDHGGGIGVALDAGGDGSGVVIGLHPLLLRSDEGVEVEEGVVVVVVMRRGSDGGSVVEGEPGGAAAGAEVEIQRGCGDRGVSSSAAAAAAVVFPGGGLDGAALARGLAVEVMVVRVMREVDEVGGGVGAVREGEIGLGLGASELARCGVVGPGGLLGGVECPQPDAALLARIPDLRRVPSPRPLPHPTEVNLLHASFLLAGTDAAFLRPRRHVEEEKMHTHST